MFKRLAALLLATVIAFAGGLSCPRGAIACAVARKAAHDCCAHRTALRASDCCCPASSRPTPFLGAAGAGLTADQPAKVLLTVGLPLLTPTAGLSCSCATLARHDHGLSPPDTLLSRHTSLLL